MAALTATAAMATATIEPEEQSRMMIPFSLAAYYYDFSEIPLPIEIAPTPAPTCSGDINLVSRLDPPARFALSRARCHRTSGASSFPITIQAILRGIYSSPTASVWQQIAPIVKSSPGHPEK